MAPRGTMSPVQLFYDDGCELCCRLQRWVAARDRTGLVEAIPVSGADLALRFPDLDVEKARAQLSVRSQDGQIHEGMAGLRQIALRLPALRQLAWIYSLPGVSAAASGAYRTVNRYRRRLCLRCGESWMPSMKPSRRRRRGR
jgi:predicted DCC family thiol-disulfide oxidoreductase YuxK